MLQEDNRSYQVYKGLQRPLVFKGLKGIYIYLAFGVAGLSMVIMSVASALGGFLVGGFMMLATLFGGIIVLALWQKKNGLYRKRVDNKIYVVKNIFIQ